MRPARSHVEERPQHEWPTMRSRMRKREARSRRLCPYFILRAESPASRLRTTAVAIGNQIEIEWSGTGSCQLEATEGTLDATESYQGHGGRESSLRDNHRVHKVRSRPRGIRRVPVDRTCAQNPQAKPRESSRCDAKGGCRIASSPWKIRPKRNENRGARHRLPIPVPDAVAARQSNELYSVDRFAAMA